MGRSLCDTAAFFKNFPGMTRLSFSTEIPSRAPAAVSLHESEESGGESGRYSDSSTMPEIARFRAFAGAIERTL
jgi:hypothetical protein